jgi:hypothetical protein
VANKKGMPSLSNPNHGPSRQLGKTDVNDRTYIEGRNSPTHALRTIIRNFYSNRPYDDKTLCTAVVIQVAKNPDSWLKSFWSALRLEGQSSKRYKVRVIDDPRHAVLPIPQTPKSVENEFYPWASPITPLGGKEVDLKIGAVVTVQFMDIASQFGTHPFIDQCLIASVLDNPTGDRELSELFKNCTIPRPTKSGKKKTTVGKACSGPAYTPGRNWQPPPKPVQGTPASQIEHPAFPVDPADTSYIDDLLKDGMLDPAKEAEALAVYEQYVTSEVKMRNGKPHKGVDFRAKMGATIHAVFDGTIERVQEHKEGFGWYIVIKHDQFQQRTFYTLYAHLEKPVTLKAGDQVKKSQQIGISGATGVIRPPGRNGAHLHFEVLYDTLFLSSTEALDPKAFFLNTGYNK